MHVHTQSGAPFQQPGTNMGLAMGKTNEKSRARWQMNKRPRRDWGMVGQGQPMHTQQLPRVGRGIEGREMAAPTGRSCQKEHCCQYKGWEINWKMDPTSPLNNSTRTTHLTYLLLPSVFPQKTAGVELEWAMRRLRRELGKVRLGRRMSSPGFAATPREQAQTLQHVAGVSVCPLRPGL